MTAPPLSGRVAHCRDFRRGVSAVVKVPRKEAVLIEPEGLSGNYVARIVTTIDVCDVTS